jgi:uncharacterized surface protein with fasciclin (FAS1) repeats
MEISFKRFLIKQFRRHLVWIFLNCIMTSVIFVSCDSDPYGDRWTGNQLTIGQYLENNKNEFSKSYELLEKGKMRSALFAYNPYGEGYTLFLPTNEAIDRFIQKQSYGNFEELLRDTNFIYTLMRYHTLKKQVHTNDFPFGVIRDSTFSGNRLSVGFYPEGNSHLIKINNIAPIIKSNLEMTNGYIHVISEVLQQTEVSGYDWIQQQDGYSILARALEVSGIKSRLWWTKYTILAEHDSIYHKKGIFNIEDLTKRVATPGMSLTNRSNSFYKFVGYHIMGGEFYLNELYWGNRKYTTLESNPLTIIVGTEIKINPGIDDYGYTITASGDTTMIDYVSPIWENCNIVTRTGPIHSISDVLFYLPVP